MKLVADTHTHTLSSGHAYSTIAENARQAAINGMEAIAMTDHGPSLMGSPTLLHFWNLRVIPDYIDGVRIIKGAEADILDFSGKLDIPDELLAKLEFVIASFHDIVIRPGSVEENTQGMICALKNPFVDAIAHPGNPVFQVDIDRVVRAAAEYNKLIEINNGSFRVRKGSESNCTRFVEKCRQYGAGITCGTDAHICYDIGKFGLAQKVIEDAAVPEELVLSTSLAKVEEYLKERMSSKLKACEVK